MNLANLESMMLNNLESKTVTMLMHCYRFAMSLTTNGSSNLTTYSDGEHQNRPVIKAAERLNLAANRAMMGTLVALDHLSNVAHCLQLEELQ